MIPDRGAYEHPAISVIAQAAELLHSPLSATDGAQLDQLQPGGCVELGAVRGATWECYRLIEASEMDVYETLHGLLDRWQEVDRTQLAAECQAPHTDVVGRYIHLSALT